MIEKKKKEEQEQAVIYEYLDDAVYSLADTYSCLDHAGDIYPALHENALYIAILEKLSGAEWQLGELQEQFSGNDEIDEDALLEMIGESFEEEEEGGETN